MKIAIAVLLGCAVLACAQESVHLSDWVGLAEDALLDASNSESPPYETLKQSDLWEERRYYEGKRRRSLRARRSCTVTCTC